MSSRLKIEKITIEKAGDLARKDIDKMQGSGCFSSEYYFHLLAVYTKEHYTDSNFQQKVKV